MAKISKKAVEAKKIIGDQSQDITNAIKLLKEASYEKFDPTFSASIDLNIDPRKADQQLRGSIILPHGTGKKVTVLAIVEEGDIATAKKAGADYAETIDIMKKVEGENWFDFDIIVTTPKVMPQLSKYGKLLGTKGLMPNPKVGTVNEDVAVAIENIKKGQVIYKTDDKGVMNIMFGKKSFDDKQLEENYQAIIDLLKAKKPAAVKGDLIKTIYVSTTMSPSIKIKEK